jgi:hypothetical protein
MGKYFVLVVAMISILAGCSKKPVEPSQDELMSALPACANGGCKDFQKVSCAPAGDPDGLNSAGEFKCKVSYVPAAGEAKTEEACFVSEAGKWKQKDGACL